MTKWLRVFGVWFVATALWVAFATGLAALTQWWGCVVIGAVGGYAVGAVALYWAGERWILNASA